MKFRYLIPIGVFVLLVAVFARGLQLDPTRVPSPLIDKPAPEFDLPTLYDPDKRFTRETLVGRVSLYNVFASWCTACRLEHPLLMELDRTGKVPVYGLNYKDKRENALQWLGDLGDPYTAIAYDFPGRSAFPKPSFSTTKGSFATSRSGRWTGRRWRRRFYRLSSACRAKLANLRGNPASLGCVHRYDVVAKTGDHAYSPIMSC
jgi:cytochrome c biogenesis protein CcmG/thiol:disulfide interchange protein DsbE